jgi:hypothetical protein
VLGENFGKVTFCSFFRQTVELLLFKMILMVESSINGEASNVNMMLDGCTYRS